MGNGTSTLKADARRVIDELPDDVTVHELWAAIDAFVVRKKIERGLAASSDGSPRYTTEEVMVRLGLSEQG